MQRRIDAGAWLGAALLLLSLPGRGGVEDSSHVFIVGESVAKVETLLARQPKPSGYQDFYQQNACAFEGVPYGSGGKGSRAGQTVVNLEQMDCVTFVENMLALALTAKAETSDSLHTKQSFSRFAEQLKAIRYYNGENRHWQDRITYFSAELQQLQAAGLVTDIAAQNGSPYSKSIYYVSHHLHNYPGVTDLSGLRAKEKGLSASRRYYYPLTELDNYISLAQTGDIIALCSAHPGLDVAHCGFAEMEGGELRFTHASSRMGRVVISQNLKDYLSTRTDIEGIMVFRPIFW